MGDALFSRQFIRSEDVLDAWKRIEPYFDQLRDRSLKTPDEVEKWLIDYCELSAALAEVGTDRHVKMTCQTDDESRKKAFFDFLENIDPQVKPRAHELNIKYAQAPASQQLPKARYEVLDRSIRATVEVYCDENVPLQVEEGKLEQKYQELGGGQTVTFDGREQTLQQLAIYTENIDRQIRQDAWETATTRRLQDKGAMEDIFDQLVALRDKMARNADCEDYRAYAFKVKQRFDYTPDDCMAFHDAVERAVVPVVRELQHKRKDALGVDMLRPWDLAVDVKGRGPLHPFETVEQLCERASKTFHRVDAELGDQFDEMRANHYLDLQSRKGKAPGGYQATYEEARHPFIFMNAVGVQRDVGTLVHEGGHAFHCYAARHDAIYPYRSSPIEFAEVASFGMELLAMDKLDDFYQGDEAARAKRTQLEGVIELFPWVATIDAFQHWLYTHPSHTRDERRAHWLSLHERFGGITDYTGYEDALAYAWHKQLHLFEVPFYYIEYGIAKLGALQVWRNSLSDYPSAVESYKSSLALGGSKTLPELFHAAGAKFDFSYETLAPLMSLVQNKLNELPL